MRQSATRTGKPAARQRTCKLLAQTLIVLTLALALPSGVQASLAIGNNGSFTQRWRDRAPVPTVAFAHAVRGQAASAGGIVKAGIGASAVTDGVTTSPTAPTVTSFTPTSGPEGATVTITGTSFADASKVTFSGTSSTFKVLSSTRITAIVPTRAASGRIAVTNPVGTGSSSTDFTVIPTPAVTSFTPPSGPVSTVVTIDGRGFAGATKVTFNGTAATFSLVSSARISATVPIGATSGRIAITTPGGTATSATSFTVAQAPTVTGFTPTSGPVGTGVTISGSGFIGATRVTFNGTSATTFRVVGSTQITASVPTGATTGKLAVATPGGTAASATSFAVTSSPAPPAVTSFTPTSGPVGANVTISGSGFTGATKVTFNGRGAAFNVVGSTRITATVPTGATSGRIAVTTPGGTASSSSSFIVVAAPSITSFTPTEGPIRTDVSVAGKGFTGATKVTLNGKATTFRVLSATQIKATVPAGATTGKIAVTTPGGTATSATSYTVTPAPTVTSFTPTSGPVGTNVTVSGKGFTGTTAVTFHGAAANYNVVSSTRITATVPAGATSGTIAVTNPGGKGASATSFTVIAAPTVTSFAPTSGPVGTKVSVNGTGFTGATAVTFGGRAATFSVVSGTRITATVPTGATTGKIAVTTPGGTATSAASFTVIPAPAITYFTPTSGPAGTAVTLIGSALSGATAVSFNGAEATFSLISDTQITATVPAGATSGSIAVTTPGGSGSSAASFTVIPTPTIVKLNRTSGRRGATVTIGGSGFGAPRGSSAVKFGNTMCSKYLSWSDRQIKCKVPAEAGYGKVKVTVTTDGGTSNAVGFRVKR